MNSAIYGAVIAALVGPFVAYLAAARRLSGRIATSDAAELWKESTALRAEYRNTIKALYDEIEKLNLKIENLAEENKCLRIRLRKLDNEE